MGVTVLTQFLKKFIHKENNKKSVKSGKEIKSCTNGKIVNLESVHDKVFSTKILGDGYAVIPKDTTIFSPVSGYVKDISENGFAVTIKSDDGLSILIHFGLNLNSKMDKAVALAVKSGDRISSGDIIGKYNFSELGGLDPTICVIVTNSYKLTSLCVRTGETSSVDAAAVYSI